MSTAPATAAKPEIVAVSDLLDGVMSGEIRVPRFQRPYVWGPEDMLQLFDSVLRGYPIGSLLIWQTERDDITSLDAIGPIDLPADGPRVKQYVVDGHQRLATMLGVLKLPESYPRVRRDDWRWWIAYDLRAEEFVHLKDASLPIPLHLLPLRSVLRTVDFARRTREMITSMSEDENQIDVLLDRADYVQKTIREYRVPMTLMRSGSLDDAVNIFARVNQRGRDMTPDQMVSALTFRDRSEGDFDLAGEIDRVQGALREFGFADLHRRIILQVILAMAGLDFTRPSYERIVNRNSHSQMRLAVKSAGKAIADCVAFLVKMVGLRTSRLLPYSSIIVLLSMYFDELRKSKVKAGPEQHKILEKWFWATSFNGWFAGATTTELRQGGELMKGLAAGKSLSDLGFEKFFFSKKIRPFPETFDRRSARVRASLLVQMLSGIPRNPRTADVFDASAVLADSDARDLPYFFPNQKRPAVSNPANRVVLPEGFARNARAAFLDLDPGRKRDLAVLTSHFITEEAFDALKSDSFELFISLREASILTAEDEFLAKFDLAIDEDAVRNGEEVDIDS